MYYHLLIETIGKNGLPKSLCVFDMADVTTILKKYVIPYWHYNAFRIEGYELFKKVITRFLVVATEKESESWLADAFGNEPALIPLEKKDIFRSKYAIDKTEDLLDIAKGKKEAMMGTGITAIETKDIFIVHGHDTGFKEEVARFLEHLKLRPIILHEQPSKGRTIIEKFESNTNVGFAIVLYTPCDQCSNPNGSTTHRARQNVVFEHGYLIAKLGREKVCALVKGHIEIPTDIAGIVYISVEKEDWRNKLADEMKEVGIPIDKNNL